MRWMQSPWADRPEASAKLAPFAPRPYLAGVTQVTLSPSAAKRVAFIAGTQGKPAVLRLSVAGGGCAGFSYKVELGEPEADDQMTSTDGVSLVIDPVSLELLQGSEVDYVEDLGGASFKVTNPNAASGCGCGSSFSV